MDVCASNADCCEGNCLESAGNRCAPKGEVECRGAGGYCGGTGSGSLVVLHACCEGFQCDLDGPHTGTDYSCYDPHAGECSTEVGSQCSSDSDCCNPLICSEEKCSKDTAHPSFNSLLEFTMYVPEWYQWTDSANHPHPFEPIPWQSFSEVLYAFLWVQPENQEKFEEFKAGYRKEFNIPEDDKTCGSSNDPRAPCVTYDASKPPGSIIAFDYNVAFEQNFQEAGVAGLLAYLSSLKKDLPDLKVGPSIGGWSLSNWFSVIFANQQYRNNFVSSVVEMAKTYNWDMIDLDWESPGCSRLPTSNGKGACTAYTYGDETNDGNNLALVLHQLRSQLNSAGLGHVKITTATMASTYTLEFLEKSLDVLDRVALMTYDFVTGWNVEATGQHQSNLYSNSEDVYSVDGAVKSILATGYAKEKVQIGAPLYGRGWNFKNWNGKEPLITNSVINGPLKSFDMPATSGEAGVTGAAYYSDMTKNCEVRYDDEAEAAYCFSVGADGTSGEVWSYDNKRALEAKADYACAQGLAGLIVWDLKEARLGWDVEAQEFRDLLAAINKCKERPARDVTITSKFDDYGNCGSPVTTPPNQPAKVPAGKPVTVGVAVSDGCQIAELDVDGVVVPDVAGMKSWEQSVVPEDDVTIHAILVPAALY